MIHLHRMVRELDKLVKIKSSAAAIDKCDEILNACRALLNEHGANSDVSRGLNIIIQTIPELRTYLTRQDYRTVEDRVRAIDLEIKKIGKILKLEFREIES